MISHRNSSLRHPILCLTSTFPRWDHDTEPNFVHQLVKYLSSAFTFHVIAPHYPGAQRTEHHSRYTVYRYRYFATSRHTLCYNGGILANLKSRPLTKLLIFPFLISQIWTIIRHCRRTNYFLVHCHWWFPQAFCYLAASFFFRQRPSLLITLHGGDLYFSRSKLLKHLMRFVIARANHITVVSRQMKMDCIAVGVDASAITVAPMGIDTDIFRSTTAPSLRSGIIFVGRIVEKKGLIILLHALPIVLKYHPHTHLTVIGDGPEFGTSKQLANNLGLSPYVEFLGAMSHEEIPLYLNAHQIAVVPSIVATSGDTEGLGLTVVEAAACGCVVVASDIDAIKDVISSGVTGILFPRGNSQELARALISVLSNPVRVATLAQNASKAIPDLFNWTVCSDRYASIYSQLIRAQAN